MAASIHFQLSNLRAEPLPPYPPKPTPSPPRATPTPSYTTSEHPAVHSFFAHISYVLQCRLNHYFRPHPTIFALAALAVFAWPDDPVHAFFWSTSKRADTAADVQRVLESGEALIIPVFWPGVEGALALLADREARIAAAAIASLKRKAQESGAKGAEPPQKMQRVTRASVRQQQTPGDTTTTPPSEKKRRAPPPPSETPTPQRASARQQEKKMPAAMRARSTSQDSSETIVASSSSSRAVSVADSADTVVGGDHNKGTPADESVAPIVAEATRMLTRSRTAAPARPTPYPATKTAGKRAPTGKRKTAKSRV